MYCFYGKMYFCSTWQEQHFLLSFSWEKNILTQKGSEFFFTSYHIINISFRSLRALIKSEFVVIIINANPAEGRTKIQENCLVFCFPSHEKKIFWLRKVLKFFLRAQWKSEHTLFLYCLCRHNYWYPVRAYSYNQYFISVASRPHKIWICCHYYKRKSRRRKNKNTRKLLNKQIVYLSSVTHEWSHIRMALDTSVIGNWKINNPTCDVDDAKWWQ
jgi:hypothetical protein